MPTGSVLRMLQRFAWAPEFRDRLRDSAVVRQMWLSVSCPAMIRQDVEE